MAVTFKIERIFWAWSAAAVVWIAVSKMLLLKEPKLYVNLNG